VIVPAVTAVILAVGCSTRMGRDKLFMAVRGTPMIERVLHACSGFPTVVVASGSVVPHVPQWADVILNAQPERGMAHSLALANEDVAPDQALLVLLGDKPLVTAALLKRVLSVAAKSRADICYPQRDGIGGHPVYFGPLVRTSLRAIAGELLQAVRDNPRFRGVPFACADEGAYLDIDEPGALQKLNE